MIAGALVRLVGISRHGKNRVRENGELWIVREVRDGRVALDSVQTDDWRWVFIADDRNFNMTLEGER